MTEHPTYRDQSEHQDITARAVAKMLSEFFYETLFLRQLIGLGDRPITLVTKTTGDPPVMSEVEFVVTDLQEPYRWVVKITCERTPE